MRNEKHPKKKVRECVIPIITDEKIGVERRINCEGQVGEGSLRCLGVSNLT